jgi:acetyl-CoA carboxylase carboxyltransferase component
LVEDLEERRAKIRLGGGEEKIVKQHERGKLTARERIALLIDAGTFNELGIHGKPHFSQRAMDHHRLRQARRAPRGGLRV